jgi:hypothetical protein
VRQFSVHARARRARERGARVAARRRRDGDRR